MLYITYAYSHHVKSEAQAVEQQHAMRTAMLATCEAQLTQVQSDLQQKLGAEAETSSRINGLQEALARTEESLTAKENELQRKFVLITLYLPHSNAIELPFQSCINHPVRCHTVTNAEASVWGDKLPQLLAMNPFQRSEHVFAITSFTSSYLPLLSCVALSSHSTQVCGDG